MGGTRFSFVKLPVGDLAAQERFYTIAFGFTVAFRIRGGEDEGEHDEVVLTAPGDPGANSRLLLTRFIHRSAPTPGQWIVGLDVDDMDATIGRAVGAGGRIVEPARHFAEHGLSIALVADPEDNVIELMTQEAPGS